MRPIVLTRADRSDTPWEAAASSRKVERPGRTQARAAEVAAGLLLAVTGFQIALVAGAPWGEATQGGRATTVDGVLATGGRVLAALSALALVAAAWVLLARAGVVASRVRPATLVVPAWAVVGVLALTTLGNVAGQHPFERFGMGAVSFVAMVLATMVARGPRPNFPAARRGGRRGRGS